MKEHVKQHEGGPRFCAHCGGGVDADGYSDGGMVKESEDEAMLEGHTNDEPQQGQAAERMRDASGFVNAIRNRSR